MRAMIKRLTFLSDAYNFLLLVYQRIFENKNFKNNLKIFFFYGYNFSDPKNLLKLTFRTWGQKVERRSL